MEEKNDQRETLVRIDKETRDENLDVISFLKNFEIRMKERMDKQDLKFDDLNSKLNSIDEKLNNGMKEMRLEMDIVNEKVENVNHRIEYVEGKVNTINFEVREYVNQKIVKVGNECKEKVEKCTEIINEEIIDMKEKCEERMNEITKEIESHRKDSMNIVNLNSEMQKFDGNFKFLHPKTYIKNLDNKIRGIGQWGDKKEFIRSNLVSYALIWYESQEDQLLDYEGFKIKSIKQFHRAKQKCAKLMFPFEGPYIVDNENPVNSYKLKDPNTGRIKGIFNVEDVYQFKQLEMNNK